MWICIRWHPSYMLLSLRWLICSWPRLPDTNYMLVRPHQHEHLVWELLSQIILNVNIHTFLFSRFRTFLSMMATAVWTGSEPSGNTGPPSPAAFCTDEFFFGGIIYLPLSCFVHTGYCVCGYSVGRKCLGSIEGGPFFI